MNTFEAIIRLARPQQWLKNIFVFAVLIFAGRAMELDAIELTLTTFFSFCLASSAIYFLNDYKDIEEDKNHPIKQYRPMASGALPPWVGVLGCLLLATTSLAIAYLFVNLPTTLVVSIYLVLNFAYSLGLKHIVIIDVLCIASGFVLRILAGSAALSASPSTWLVLCGVMISLFLAFTKRRGEVTRLGERATEHRKVLAEYSTAFLDQAISIVTTATVVGYVLYTVDERTVELVGSRAMLLSVPPVLYGIFRYLYLVYHERTAEDPTRTVFADVPILITGVIWGICCMLVIFFGKSIGDTLL